MTKKFKRNLKFTFKNKALFMSFCHLNCNLFAAFALRTFRISSLIELPIPEYSGYNFSTYF